MKLQRNRNYSILIESTIEIRFGFFQQQKLPLQHLVKMSQQDKAQQQNHTIMKRWALKSKMRLIWCSSLCFIIHFFYLSLCDFGMQVHFCSQPVFDLFGCSPGIFHYKFNYSMVVLWFFLFVLSSVEGILRYWMHRWWRFLFSMLLVLKTTAKLFKLFEHELVVVLRSDSDMHLR